MGSKKNTYSFKEPGEFCRRPQFNFGERGHSIVVDCSFGNAQLLGNLLAREALCYFFSNFFFTFTERPESLQFIKQIGCPASAGAVLFNGARDCRQVAGFMGFC